MTGVHQLLHRGDNSFVYNTLDQLIALKQLPKQFGQGSIRILNLSDETNVSLGGEGVEEETKQTEMTHGQGEDASPVSDYELLAVALCYHYMPTM